MPRQTATPTTTQVGTYSMASRSSCRGRSSSDLPGSGTPAAVSGAGARAGSSSSGPASDPPGALGRARSCHRAFRSVCRAHAALGRRPRMVRGQDDLEPLGGRLSGAGAGSLLEIERITRGNQSDQDQHDQAHTFLAVVRSMRQTDTAAGHEQGRANPTWRPCAWHRPGAGHRAGDRESIVSR